MGRGDGERGWKDGEGRGKGEGEGGDNGIGPPIFPDVVAPMAVNSNFCSRTHQPQYIGYVTDDERRQTDGCNTVA